MKIIINTISGNIINFDIVGKGNVVMNYYVGEFDSKPLNIEDEDIFYNYILENIDTIIEIITTPPLKTVQDFVDDIDIENIETPIDLIQWIDNTALDILIDAEDFERCDFLINIKNKINEEGNKFKK